MGSITEEQLVQMVRDFIESESAPQTSEPLPLITNHHEPTCIDTLQEIIWRATDTEVEILEKILMYGRDLGSLKEPNNHKKWIGFRLKMDGHEASLCRTSWVSFLGLTKGCLTKGDYEFIDVMIMRDVENGLNKQTRLIIDMDFRSQFELARPTPSYKSLVDCLPQIFVGTEEKLKMWSVFSALRQNSPSKRVVSIFLHGERLVTC